MSDALTAAMKALDDYMAALNRGDEPGVNAACNFPHVRLAGGKVVVWPNHGDYKLDDFIARAGDGWHALRIAWACCEHINRRAFG